MHAKKMVGNISKYIEKYPVLSFIVLVIHISLLGIISIWIFSLLVMSFIPRIITPKIPENCTPPGEILNQFNCTQDCGGYIAGFEWACRKHKEKEFYSCGGNSQSFIAGCKVFEKHFIKK